MSKSSLFLSLRNAAAGYILALAIVPGFAAQTIPTAAQAPDPVVTPASAPMATPMEVMQNKLDAALKPLDPKGPTPDLYASAKARLGEAKALLELDPQSKEASAWLQACSLLTEAAVMQMQSLSKREERFKIQEQRIATLTELNATHDEISKLERGYASSLKSDLEDQKRKAAAARDEAEKKFGELNSALIQVHRDARGTIISMSDILFDVGKATLTTDLKINLAKIAGILTIYKDANVVVEGHTDNVGGEEYNQKLSELRAGNVMEYMVAPGGIAAARLTSAGFGFSKPVADNATKEGRQKNRRVDLVILDKKPEAQP